MAFPPSGVSSPELRFRSGDDRPLVIGLVNNMPDGALRTTERQFRDLLSAASGNLAVRLRLFYLPEVPRGDAARSLLDQSYEDIGRLWTSRVDGVIVTGTEPRAASLEDEPYWPTLTRLVDWSEDNALSTIWSCLAAHAAALHMDGIHRRALGRKLSGIFDCRRAQNHSIVIRTPSRWRVPHSRYNELPEKALINSDYQILSRSPDAGADMFVKHRKALFIFFQGHPEYDRGALLREYRRDSRRFLAGDRDDYPEIPRDYFDSDTRAMLAEFRERALANPSIDLLSNFPAVSEEKLTRVRCGWAIRIYANWLSYLMQQKSQSIRSMTPQASAPDDSPDCSLVSRHDHSRV